MTATDSAPDLDLLDYTAQAQQLVSDLQRLKAAATVFDEAGARLEEGRAAIDEAAATLADRSDMALLIYEDALQTSKHALAEAVARMDAAAALASQSGAVLDDLQQLHDASQALTGAQATIEHTAALLAGHGDALHAGADAYRDAIHDGVAARNALEAGRQGLQDASAGLDAAAGRVDSATAAVFQQADLIGQGAGALQRAATVLNTANGDLAASRESLNETQSLLVIAANQLSAAHDRSTANTTTLEAAARQFAATQAALAAMRSTLETAHATLAGAVRHADEQKRAISAATHELGTVREELATGFADVARQQLAADATLRALTTASEERALQMSNGLDRLDARLIGLHPVVNQLARSGEEIGSRLDRNAKNLEVAVEAALRTQGAQLVADQRAQAEQLEKIQEKMRLLLWVAGGVLVATVVILAFIVQRGG